MQPDKMPVSSCGQGLPSLLGQVSASWLSHGWGLGCPRKRWCWWRSLGHFLTFLLFVCLFNRNSHLQKTCKYSTKPFFLLTHLTVTLMMSHHYFKYFHVNFLPAEVFSMKLYCSCPSHGVTVDMLLSSIICFMFVLPKYNIKQILTLIAIIAEEGVQQTHGKDVPFVPTWHSCPCFPWCF